MNPLPRTGKYHAPSARLLACLLMATALLGAGLLEGATSSGPSVNASLADPSLDVGQPTEYRIDVIGAQPDRPPPAPVAAGLNITYAGQSYSSQIDFNTLTKTTTLSYVYSVEPPARAGQFTIPGQDLQVDGRVLHVPPVTLTVGESGKGTNRQVFVELLVPKKSAYLGEAIPVEVRIFFAANVEASLTPDLILNGEGFSVAKFTPQKEVPHEAVDGVTYQVASAKSAITGLRIGTLSVGPVEVDPVVKLPRSRSRRRSIPNDPLDAFFNNNFGGMNLAEPRQMKLLSEPVSVEIKPLPVDGKPPDFTGAVGQFRLEAEAEPRKAAAGDPVTVHLVLSGRGNFDRVTAPSLSDEQGLRTYPAKERFRADDGVGLSGVKTFDQVVIADGPRTSLPAYHFNYFDPAAGKYVVLDTAPLAVRIEGGVSPTPLPAVGGATSPAARTNVAAAGTPPLATPPPPPRPAEDILYIRTDRGSSRGRDAFSPAYLQRGFWLTQGGVLVALLGCAAVGFTRRRTRDESARHAASRQRLQSELQRALQSGETKRGDFYAAATRLLQLRTAAGTARPDAWPSVQEICRDRRLDPVAEESLQTIFRRHDELAYSGGAAAEEPVSPDERHTVLSLLESMDRPPVLR